MARINARRRGSEFKAPQRNFISLAFGMSIFQQRVLEEGRTHKMYKTKIFGYEGTAIALGKYSNNSGLLCRKITTDNQQWGMPEKRTMNSFICCRYKGKWVEVEHIDRRDY